ncbi:sodium/solute symporter [Spirosoma sp. SC4-14]|uniref:SLC5 family protein n=1 Tax=Spirosoma sp. SC4-14 TaxID=3128900 RepID=UPI0030D2DE72
MDYLTIGVFVVYFAGILAIGLRAGRREKKTADDYFLAGRRLPWYAVGLSMAGANFSTEHFIGMVGTAYFMGVAPANWELIAFVPLSLLIFIFLPYYFRKKIYTVPQFLENRFNGTTRLIFAGIIIVHSIIAILAGVLYGGGLIFQELFAHDEVRLTEAGQISPSLLLGIGVLAVTTGIYSVKGGLAAVVWTDVVQVIILIIGGSVVTAIAINRVGGWNELWRLNQQLASGRIHLFQPATDPVVPWTGLVTIWLTISIWYNCANQFYIQQCFAARSEWDARMGIVLVATIKLLKPLIIVVPGMAALLIFGQGVPQDKVFVKMVQELVPEGIRSIVLTGMAAGIMSTISSVLNSISTIFTIDIFQRYLRPEASQQQLVRVGRWAVAVALLIATGIAPFILLLGKGLFIYIQDLASYFAPPISVIFLVGILWRKASARAANSTLIAGIVFGVFLKLITPELPTNLLVLMIPFLNRAFVCWLFSLSVMVLVSLLGDRLNRKRLAEDIIWKPSYMRLSGEERSRHRGWQNFMVWWSIALVLRIIVYVVYA